MKTTKPRIPTPTLVTRFVRAAETNADVTITTPKIRSWPKIMPRTITPKMGSRLKIMLRVVDVPDDVRERNTCRLTANEAAALNALAQDIAQEMNEDNFSSRRGAQSLEPHRGRMAGFYLYDNNPYGDDPIRPRDAEGTRRAAEHAEVIALMATRGCTLVARASYPTTGDVRGYTVALVFISATPEAAKQDLHAASDRWHDVIMRRFTDAECLLKEPMSSDGSFPNEALSPNEPLSSDDSFPNDDAASR